MSKATMPNSEQKLSELRAEIDQIDDAIHDLIMRRTKVVERVAEAKRGARIKIRPAREAEILYRLMARHRGKFPRREIARIWREVIVATLGIEGPFSIAAWVCEGDSSGWDLARDHFGSFSAMTAHGSTWRVVEAVRSGEATVGILPLTQQDEPQPWWPSICNSREGTPRIIARLPFVPGSNSRNRNAEGLVICAIDQEPTGRDRSLIAFDASQRIGRQRVAEVLAEHDLSVSFVAAHQADTRPELWWYLVEVDEFLAVDDPRKETLRTHLGGDINRVISLGGYAMPMTDDDLQD